MRYTGQALTSPLTTCQGCVENQPNQLAHMDEGGCLYIPPSQDDYYIEPETESDDEFGHILNEVTAHTAFGEQMASVGFEVFEDTEDDFDTDNSYSREDILNIFPEERYPAFTAEIKLAFEEGEMISKIDLYEIMGMYGLSIPGFDLIYDSSANPQDSFNMSFENIVSVPPPVISTPITIVSVPPPVISTPITLPN
jgi:hypothetical protein